MHWFEGAGEARLERDLAIVAEDQPALRYVTQGDESLSLVGDVTFALPSGTPQAIATRIDFPSDYPSHEPLAFETASRFPHDAHHHFFSHGRCCLWLDVETKWRAGDLDALRTFLDELKVFYYRQLMMEADPTLSYPGPWRGHGVLGYIEHLEDRLRMSRGELPRMRHAIGGGVGRNAPCPCGKRIRYRNCHLEAVRHFRDLADPHSVEQILNALTAMARTDGKT